MMTLKMVWIKKKKKKNNLQGGWSIASQGERSQKTSSLLTPWSWISRGQKCKKINFCYLGHSVCGTLYGGLSKLRHSVYLRCRVWPSVESLIRLCSSTLERMLEILRCLSGPLLHWTSASTSVLRDRAATHLSPFWSLSLLFQLHMKTQISAGSWAGRLPPCV